MNRCQQRILLAAVAIVALATAQASAAPTTAPPAAAPAILMTAGQPTVYVLVDGSESNSKPLLANLLSQDLQREASGAATADSLVKHAWVVPEPDWNLATFLQACAENPNALGGYIISSPSLSVGQTSNFISRTSKAEIQFDVTVATCGQSVSTAGSAAAPAALWHYGVHGGEGSIKTYNFAPLVDVVIGTAVAFTAFIPSHTSTSVSTAVYPTTSPLSPNGTHSQSQFTSTITSNPSSLVTSANSYVSPFVGSALAQAQSNKNTTDTETARATTSVLDTLKTQLTAYCAPTTAARPANASFCDW